MTHSVFSKAAAALVFGAYMTAAAVFSASTGPGQAQADAQTTVPTTVSQTQRTTETETETETEPQTERPCVALTFDDGPSVPHTDRILDVLEANGAKATFFVVGQRVADYADVLRRAYALGCQIGNHTFDHKTLTALSEENIRTQIRKTDEAVSEILGVAPQFLRAPGGNVNAKVRQASDKPIVLWSVDTEDWRVGGKAGRNTAANRDRIIRAATENIQDGDVILMHDLYAMTAQCCETIVPRLREMGFELVTVDELMRAKGIKTEKGAVYRSAR